VVRVIAGSARGVRLKVPKGDETRPTADRVKESLFNVLGARVVDAVVLDLFAGTGALGIEALSRGAARALFVEKDPKVARLVKENLERCRLSEAARVLVSRVPPRLPLPGAFDRFDLVFLDPPYGQGLVRPTLEWLSQSGLVAAGGWVAVERSPKEEIPPALEKLSLIREKVYHDTVVSFFQSG